MNKSKKTGLSKELYFPTILYKNEVDDAESLNELLLKEIHSEIDRDKDGIQRSNFRELGGWHSQNHLHKRKAYSGLLKHVKAATDYITEDQGYDSSYKLQTTTMWSIINRPGSSNRAHIHPGCCLSGVYYVQAPKDSGDIEFIDPRTCHLMTQPKFIPDQKRPKKSWTKVRYKPTAGKMLIFPAWLYHAVHPNLSKEKGDDANRVIISFNISQIKIKK